VPYFHQPVLPDARLGTDPDKLSMDMDMDMTVPIPQTGLATPILFYSAISPTVTVGSVATDSSFGTSPLKTEDGFNDEPPKKKKQKRNKPTLSCEECVERKTKVSLSSTNPALSHANLVFGEMGHYQV